MFGVVDDLFIYLFIYFCQHVFQLQILPTYKNILLKIILRMKIKANNRKIYHASQKSSSQLNVLV